MKDMHTILDLPARSLTLSWQQVHTETSRSSCTKTDFPDSCMVGLGLMLRIRTALGRLCVCWGWCLLSLSSWLMH